MVFNPYYNRISWFRRIEIKFYKWIDRKIGRKKFFLSGFLALFFAGILFRMEILFIAAVSLIIYAILIFIINSDMKKWKAENTIRENNREIIELFEKYLIRKKTKYTRNHQYSDELFSPANKKKIKSLKESNRRNLLKLGLTCQSEYEWGIQGSCENCSSDNLYETAGNYPENFLGGLQNNPIAGASGLFCGDCGYLVDIKTYTLEEFGRDIASDD